MKDNNLSSSLFLAKEQLKSELLTKVGLWSILEVAELISGSLPTYHPDVLLTNISSGNWKRAYVAVRHLVECLTSNYDPKKRHISKRIGLPNIALSYYLEGCISKGSQNKGFQWSGDAASMTSISQAQSTLFQFPYHSGSSAENGSISSSTKSELNGFIESLEKLADVPLLIDTEKTQILAIIDLLSEVSSAHSSSAYQSLDEPGRRFWVALRFRQLLFLRKFARAASFKELLVNSRLFVWAYHSDCLDNLFGSVIPNEPSWQEMRALGMGFWYANIPQLRARMEKLARAQYLRNKNPKDCALLYIALNRIQVLASLFKISKDEKDKPLVGFLSRNFQDEKNKAAALKNAYVLLGKHQLELAIAFFLLGGDHSSAINICAKNLGDEQLALVICRLVEGHGGPLEHHLITKYILPSAIDKGDYWLASILEWEMGNYYQSFYRMLEFSVNPLPQESTVMSNCGPFLDPTVGFYCQMLATKNSMRNVVGEQNSAILLRWATLMTVTALKRCGNPLEALEYFSSSLSMLGTADQESELGDSHDVLSSTLKPLPRKCSNWLSANVSVHLEFHIKLNLALCYLSKLIREHPSWPDSFAEYSGEASHSDEFMMQYEKSVESFKQKLYTGLALFEQRFLLAPHCIISMILLLLCHHGSLYIVYDMTDGCTQGELSQKNSNIFDDFNLYYSRIKPLFKTAEEVSFLYSRFFCACSMEYSQQSSSIEGKPKFLGAMQCRFEGVLVSLSYLRAILRIQLSSISKDLIETHLGILDFYEYYLHFSLAWLQRNLKALLYMVEPFLVARSSGRNPYDVDMVNLKKLIPKIGQLLAQTSFIPNIQNLQLSERAEDKLVANIKHSIPDDERWKILGTCLWQHMSRFMISNLNPVLAKLEDGNLSGPFHRKYTYGEAYLINMDSESISLPEKIQLVSLSLCDLLMTTVTHISSYHVKQHAEFLWQKVENGLNVTTLEWLKQKSEFSQNQNLDILELGNRKDSYSVHQSLWDHCADPKLISDCFVQEKLNWPNDLDHMHTKGWNDLSIIMTGLHKTDDTCGDDCKLSTRSSNHEVGTPVKGMSLSGHASARSNQKDITNTNFALFQSSREMYKRNGELLEALCINSTDQREAAVASNRKGIMFFHLEDEIPFSSKSDNLLWAKADWPHNGWAGSESTPAPTCVSSGVGLGSKKGAHLGLDGATVGVGSSAWPSNDLTGGGVLGMLGYAGIGASGLGWEIQQDFEDFVDPPATLENISTRALSSHPMRPFFLVGSSNTHIYLWEVANCPIVSLKFACLLFKLHAQFRIQFLSLERRMSFEPMLYSLTTLDTVLPVLQLDGTVCTWQLEVGGRSNVRPTESSLCFNGHASDVTYFSSSGSIIAVAGYSSNGVNVVIWDTLAPPTTSRASILCHEGGAHTVSVFDNHVGSGSVSPLIVTGGKGGDVGIHDFRYIATGKAKRHRRADNIGQSSTSSLTRDKDQNVDGMLWYIPKAHSGSVTKVVTIPNTSLFLTGSTDGDVKLWDAQRTKLIHHWSKIHEKHTFLQPSSRGFSGVVRAAVTDIQVVSHGFLTCGGDGTVKLVRLDSHLHGHGIEL
ncbi:DmX protein 2 [Spatholobus suberectus]|nr:DmX protein 2 [Spatholobus suberectus]